MKTLLLHLLTAVHFFSIAGLALYGLHRIWMIACWLKPSCKATRAEPLCPLPPEFPTVTVQIPLYNEPLVAERIIDAVAALDWPIEKLEIQVLDDSTDDTCRRVEKRAIYWGDRGRQIDVIRRNHRIGYKAGALSAGLYRSKGEFIAVFDADFVPRPDFLQRTIPHFNRPDVGMVQARWEFLNEGYSWLTLLQSLLLSAHFGIEHQVRHSRGLFFNFNGTAGVWRRTAIGTAGGWQSDTVTEDLDLSYRAQMIGWRFVFLNDVTVSSELPITLSDFRSQQERWSRGAIQTARKLLPRLLVSPLPVTVKLEAAAHLLSNVCWMFGFLAMLTLYPALLSRVGIGVWNAIWIDLPFFTLTGIAVLFYYFLYGVRTGRKRPLWILPILPAASIGLAPYFSLAVLAGAFKRGGTFNRTPKFGVIGSAAAKRCGVASASRAGWHLVIDGILLGYTLEPVFFAWERGTWAAIPFLCWFPFGFCLLLAHELREIAVGVDRNE